MYVAVFQNMRAAIKAEQLCRVEGIGVTVMPLPESLSSECGMCLKVEDSETSKFEQTMKNAGIPVEIYDKI